MDAQAKLRQVRQVALDHYDMAPFLSPQTVADFLDGKCQLSEYQGVPIADYTRPWGSSPRRFR